MQRAMSLWLPTWATDVTRRRLRAADSGPDAPRSKPGPDVVLLTEQLRGREVVVRRCGRAAALHICLGMDLAHARSLIPAHARAHVEEHKPQRDAATLHRLACWALRFSPTVAVDPPDGLLLDATGLQRHYGAAGDTGLTRAIGSAICRMGFSVRIAVASTFAGAQAVARCGRHSVTHVPPGKDRETLAPLPVQALGIDAPTEAALRQLGLICIGDVLRLPRAALASQFGDNLLRRVDQTLGLAPEIIEPVRPEPPPQAKLVFDGPTDQWESLEAATREVLDALIATLTSRGLAARQVDLDVLRTSCRRAEPYRVQLSCASQSASHWWTMLRPVLERVDTASGVEGVVLTASSVKPLRPRQSTLPAVGQEAGDCAEETAWTEVMDTLISRLGSHNIVQFEAVESHLPEQAFRVRPAAATATHSPASITPNDRPTRLFDAPLPAVVMLQAPEGPLLHIAWGGRKQQVITCRGPERISAEWWRLSPVAAPATALSERDYFVVQTDDGTWLWVGRRVGSGRWLVHGDWA